MFVNTLAMRNFPNSTQTFENFFKDVRDRSLKAFENQDVQFEFLVDKLEPQRDPSRNPLFDVYMVTQNFNQGPTDQPRIKAKRPGAQTGTAKFDLTFFIKDPTSQMQPQTSQDEPAPLIPPRVSGGGIGIDIEYYTGIFSEATIRRLIGHFSNIIEAVTTDPTIRLSDIVLLSEAERQQVLYDFNDTAAEYPRRRTVHGLFQDQASRRPNTIAVEFKETSLTYNELNKQAGSLARQLRQSAAQRVAVWMTQPMERTIAILGTLKAGAAYVPFDPSLPPNRIKYMINDAAISCVIADEEFIETLESMALNASIIASGGPPRGMGFPAGNPKGGAIPNPAWRGPWNPDGPTGKEPENNLAYIMYTSGSTGNSKGVMVEHHSILRLVINTNYVPLNPETRILQTGSPAFDAATFEIWGSLLNGGQLIPADKDDILDTQLLGPTLLKKQINTIFFSAPLFHRLAARDTQIFAPLTYLLVGGDVLPPTFTNRVRQAHPHLRLINGYGPTENTTFTSCYLVDQDFDGPIPIGTPITNTRVLILDTDGHPQPIGAYGELCCAGEGVARGYLNNPELTAEKFTAFASGGPSGGPKGGSLWKPINGRVKDIRIPNDTAMQFKALGSPETLSRKGFWPPEARFYRSGDLARWLPDGNIEFMGRIDTQVKIRGFRIDPEEIRFQLEKHVEVKEGAVIVRTIGGEKTICAYFIPHVPHDSQTPESGKTASSETIRSFLSHHLPPFMVPTFITAIDSIPLNQNGKVDTKALPAPVLTSDQQYSAPQTDTEKRLTTAWAETLGLEDGSISSEADFFQLGGHSLRATNLVSQIHKEFQVKLPLRDVFTNTTIKTMAKKIEGLKPTSFQFIQAVEKREYYPLSSAQKRMVFLQQMDEKSTAYNMPFVLPLDKNIDAGKLEAVLKQLIARHESLRTAFIRVNENIVQKVFDNVPYNISHKKYRDDTLASSENSGISTFPVNKVVADFVRPFDLASPPLMRSALVTLPDRTRLWLVDMHHAISDGVSQIILREDFVTLYQNGNLPDQALQYKDFALWQANSSTGKDIEKQEEYWLDILSGEIPRLDLPTDFTRPEQFTFEGGEYHFSLSPKTGRLFKQLAARYRATLYMNVLAALNVLFYKYTGATDIIIGNGIAGRPHADLQRIMGMFINTLAMRNFPEGQRTFAAFLEDVTARCITGFENQDLQFEELVEKLAPERDVSRNPVFDVSMIHQNFAPAAVQTDTPAAGTFDHEKLREIQTDTGTTKFDLGFVISEQADEIRITIEYYSALFKAGTIQRMAGHFNTLIET
ncbi:MAG: amino acid adenylation domain-containing protein, partial [bacterium]|nr:amino acid adenylation domain-containing protein [bacterium]